MSHNILFLLSSKRRFFGRIKYMKKINIFINNQKFGAELNETVTAQKLLKEAKIKIEKTI